MKFSEICFTLETELYEACVSYIPLLLAELKGQHIHAFAILLDGFDSMGLCANTDEYLEARIAAEQSSEPVEFRAPAIYLEMNAAEWVHMNGLYSNFSKVNEILGVFRDKHYAETGFDDLDENLNYAQISDLADDSFKQIIINVLQRLKKEGEFSQSGFTDDVFLGVQYSDIGDPEMAAIEAVSRQLNSQYWTHKTDEIKTYMRQSSS